MINRVLNALARSLDASAGEPTHFHPGPRGPYPCHDANCARHNRS